MCEIEIVAPVRSLEVSGRGWVTGVCFARIAAISFPGEDWSDFPVVILSWWLAQLREYSFTGEATLEFMDGPFEIRLIRYGSAATLQLVEKRVSSERLIHSCKADVPVVNSAIRGAALAVLEYCRSHGWSSPDVDELESEVKLDPAV